MTRIQRFKLLTLLLLPVLSWGNHTLIEELPKSTLEKTIEKSFTVNPIVNLEVDNSYGNIDIITWEQNTIEFDITIKVTGSDEEKVADKLEAIRVEFTNSSNNVTAITRFGKKKRRSWWNWGSDNLKIEVNYIVKIPKTSSIDISNDYGAINVGQLFGRALLNCDYGKISTKELMAEDNDINFDYSNNCYFEYIKGGSINADYSSYTVNKANRLTISANYTKSEIENAEEVSYNCDYGSLKTENINSILGNGDYLTLRIGTIYKNASIKADYGSIKIDKVAATAGDLEIQSGYTGITVGHDPDYHFQFEISLDYASFKHADDFEFVKKRIESTEKYYMGYFGSAIANNRVSINSEYGSVTFKKL